MNWLDIIIIIVLAGAAIGGLANGFVKAVFSLAGLIVGVVVAGRFYTGLADRLSFISNESAAEILAFIIILLAILIIAFILGIIISKLLSAILLGWLNRLLGAVFGVVMGGLLIAAILAIWVHFQGESSVIRDSFIASIMLDRLPWILGFLPEEFDNIRGYFQ